VDIGQPTSFFVGAALNLTPQDFESEARNLRRKLKAGADFLLTQPIYEPRLAETFLKAYEGQNGRLEIPILVGILPLYSMRHAAFLHNEVPGISIPEEMRQRMQDAGSHAPQEGVRIALELVEQIKPWASGIYLMPAFGRYDLVADIIEGCR
jgi:homocysteine S-methyltransferase